MEQSQEIITNLIKKGDDEYDSAYTAFLYWASLPQAERQSFDTCARKVASYTGLAIATVKEYRTFFKWDERANLIDAHFFQLGFERRNKMSEEGDKEFVTKNRKFQQSVVKASEQAIMVVTALLDKASIAGEVKETDYVQVLQKDGTHKSMPRTTVINMEAGLKDVAPLLRSAVDALLKVSGVPTEIVEHKIAKSLNDKPLTERTEEEIVAIRQQIAREKELILEPKSIM